MCIPNKININSFPGLICPSDGLPHFTVEVRRNIKDEFFEKDQEPIREKAYEANVHFNFGEDGQVFSIDVLLISPMPEEPQGKVLPQAGLEGSREEAEFKKRQNESYNKAFYRALKR